MTRRMRSEPLVATFRSIRLRAMIAHWLWPPLLFGAVDLFWVARFGPILPSMGALCGVAAPIEPCRAGSFSAFLCIPFGRV